MKQVIQASGVLAYEPFGFTNCVRFKDVLYLSGISAIDPEGKVVGADIETQTQETYRNIQKVEAVETRSGKTRRAFGPRVVMLWRAAFENAAVRSRQLHHG